MGLRPFLQEILDAILAAHPDHFDAQLSLAMTYYRKGDFAKAIEEGHKAEKLKPNEQLVHTNLSLFYMKAGDKKPAMPIAQALLRMVASAKKFDLSKVKMSDLAFVAAGAESSSD